MANDVFVATDPSDDSTDTLVGRAAVHANRAAVEWCRLQRSRWPPEDDRDPQELYLAGLIECVAQALVNAPPKSAEAWLEAVRNSIAELRQLRAKSHH